MSQLGLSCLIRGLRLLPVEVLDELTVDVEGFGVDALCNGFNDLHVILLVPCRDRAQDFADVGEQLYLLLVNET